MNEKIKLFAISLLSSFVFLACNKKNDARDKSMEETLQKPFSILSYEDTGIAFVNVLKENNHMNGLFYEYFYNGGGVAVGDLNGDAWPDLYFVNNLKSNSLYLNNGNMRFKEVTNMSRAGGKGYSTGVTMVDINSDGRMDIYICNSGRFNDPNKRKNQLLVNMGNTRDNIPYFEDQATQYGLDLPHFSTQAAFFDYDLDGDLDMFLINHGMEIYDENQIEVLLKAQSQYRGERLFRNDNGFFKDVTENSGIINNMMGYGLGLAIGDLNNDNFPDVYVSNDFSEKDHLYLNNGDGTFKESSEDVLNHISNFSMGNDIADINNDGWMDIMTVDMVSEDSYGIKTSMSGMDPDRFYRHVNLGLHHQYMFNTLQLNNGRIDDASEMPSFSEIAHLSGLPNTDWSWSPLFFDFDNDGYNDLFISNGIKRDFRNNDFQIFHRQERERAVADHEKGIPFNQDAFIAKLLSKMPVRKRKNYFYRNNKDLTFDKVEGQWKDEPTTSSNGAAYADLDNDGDLDVVVNNSDDQSFIYQNNAVENLSGNFLKVKLIGPNGNVDGIGSKIYVHTQDNVQKKEQFLTRGFQSCTDRVIHFGLGQVKRADSIRITWPDGKQQLIRGIKANTTITFNHDDAGQFQLLTKAVDKKIFRTIADMDAHYHHQENVFDDFERERLLPHRMSQQGPALAVSDVNGDGLEDFYIGGALGQKPALFLQTKDGSFSKSRQQLWEEEKKYEDVAAVFFDVDQDGDNDLYVSSGGNEKEEGTLHYQDRLYVNQGNGAFKKHTDALPKITISSSCVKAMDYDNDGDMDLFVGGRQSPGRYPYPTNSYILRNDSTSESPHFSDVTAEIAPDFIEMGMVTDATWADINSDGLQDLVIVGEWMPIKVFENAKNRFKDITENVGLSEQTGWWYSILTGDFDNDGDLDIVAGNLGLNYKYRTTEKEPFEIYFHDFDDNGTSDIVLGYHDNGNLVPLRGRECSSQQMPFIKEKFKTYEAFGKADILDIYGKDKLDASLHYGISTFASTYYENKEGTYVPHRLPIKAQMSSTNSIIANDFNNDGSLDLLLAGNLYGAEVETPRNDASYGLLLIGNGKGNFTPLLPHESGLSIRGEVRYISTITTKKLGKTLLIARNNLPLQWIDFSDNF